MGRLLGPLGRELLKRSRRSFQSGGDLRPAHQPGPRTFQRLSPLVKRLYVITFTSASKELPDRRLRASVTSWKCSEKAKRQQQGRGIP